MHKDVYARVVSTAAVIPQTINSGGGAVVSAAQDLLGFGGALVQVAFGAPGDTLSASNKFTVTLEDAPDNGGSPGTWVPVDDIDVSGVVPASGVVLTVDADGEASGVHDVGYIGGKRWLRVTVTPVGTLTNGTPISVTVAKGSPQVEPAPR